MAAGEKVRARCQKCGAKGNIPAERLESPIKCPQCGLRACWDAVPPEEETPVRIALPQAKSSLPSTKPTMPRPRPRTGTPPSGNTVHVEAERIDARPAITGDMCGACGAAGTLRRSGWRSSDIWMFLVALSGAQMFIPVAVCFLIFAEVTGNAPAPHSERESLKGMYVVSAIASVFLSCVAASIRSKMLVCDECGAIQMGAVRSEWFGNFYWGLSAAAALLATIAAGGVGFLGWIAITICTYHEANTRIERYTQRERERLCGYGYGAVGWVLMTLTLFPFYYPLWCVVRARFPDAEWQKLAERNGYFRAIGAAV